MDAAPPTPESFQETFCAQYGVPADRYSATVLRLTLYPHARWLAGVASPAFLAPDRTFIASVGQLTRWRGFAGEADEFQRSPENQGFWRRTLRLRVSVGRMRVLFSEVMGGTPARPDKRETRQETRAEPESLAPE